MAQGKFVSYLRVSTAKQGASGLGLDAQRKAVSDYLNGGQWSLMAEVVEVESGKRDDRPKLAEAMALCRVHGATLVIAKLDRLSRDAHFLLGLQKAGVRFVAADMPQANELTIGLLAVVAQHERQMISRRTKEALAAAKARGVVMGGFRGYVPSTADIEAATATRRALAASRAADLAPIVADLRAGGATSLREIAAGLNQRGIPTARNGSAWSPTQVARLLDRIEIQAA